MDKHSLSMHILLRNTIFSLVLISLATPDGVDTAFAQQTGSSVQGRRSELKKLRDEIQRFETRIKDSEKREQSTLHRLDDYDRQNSLIRVLLDKLTEEIAQNQKDIAVAQLNLSTAENELRLLKREYARTVLNMYKRGRTHDTELLLSSRSVNELFIRSKYLRAYSERARKDAKEIRLRKEKIELQKAQLERRLEEQQLAINERRSEEQSLQRSLAQHRQLLQKVRQDKQSYEQQLRRKREAAQRVERIIADLIERERRRLEEERRKKARAENKTDTELKDLPSVPISSTAFGRLQGRLPWPVSQGAVVGYFGENTHPTQGTVTLSPGIDIAVPNGSAVRSVADGLVKIRSFIAGYGNLLIIEHGEGFFTVYAHLSTISVKEGQKVKAGQTIGKSGEGLSGPRLHFELYWNEKKQDPLIWLSKR